MLISNGGPWIMKIIFIHADIAEEKEKVHSINKDIVYQNMLRIWKLLYMYILL
jgi:hypothetical protein